MVAENLANMDEVEEMEEVERALSTSDPSGAESGSGVAGVPDFGVDWSSLDFGPLPSGLDLSADPGSGGDIPQASAGSSSGA